MPSDKEMINNLIDTYANLQRIKTAENTERELASALVISAGIFWHCHKRTRYKIAALKGCVFCTLSIFAV